MKFTKLFFLVVAGLFFLPTAQSNVSGQTGGKTYQQMSRNERSAFVAAQARRIAKELSGNDYDFTTAFEEDIQQAVNKYARRVGDNGNETKRDLRTVFERARPLAPALMTPFRARNMSPLFGLYLPFIESEYINIDTPTPMGSVGMFQFLPQTGARYGLTREELFDVAKSADAAARYISDSIKVHKNDPMKEALAVLSYNRGAGKVKTDLKLLLNDQNKQCSICALGADRGKLDEGFRNESVFYVPLFFAAAIIGENPQVFGLGVQPLSSN